MKTFWLYISIVLITIVTACNNTDTAQKEINIEKQVVSLEGKTGSTASLSIEGMSCEVNCAKKIQKHLSGLKGVENCTVNFEEKAAAIDFDQTLISMENILTEISGLAKGQYSVSKVKVTEYSDTPQNNPTEATEKNSAVPEESKPSIKIESFKIPSIFDVIHFL